MFSAFNPSHTLGAVGSRLCGARGAVMDTFEPTTLGDLGFQVQHIGLTLNYFLFFWGGELTWAAVPKIIISLI